MSSERDWLSPIVRVLITQPLEVLLEMRRAEQREAMEAAHRAQVNLHLLDEAIEIRRKGLAVREGDTDG